MHYKSFREKVLKYHSELIKFLSFNKKRIQDFNCLKYYQNTYGKRFAPILEKYGFCYQPQFFKIKYDEILEELKELKIIRANNYDDTCLRREGRFTLKLAQIIYLAKVFREDNGSEFLSREKGQHPNDQVAVSILVVMDLNF